MGIKMHLKKFMAVTSMFFLIAIYSNAQVDSVISRPFSPPDSSTAAANSNFKAGSFKRLLVGSNYRDEWTTPVKVRVINIGKEYGGLTPTERGGGHQTRSLRLHDVKGKEYVLRSIQKYPDQVIPPDLRETFLKDIVTDAISASYPFSSLSIPPLSDAAGVPHTTPQLVYVADDPGLRNFQKDFANALYLFEERDVLDSGKTFSTARVYDKLKEDNDNTVDQQALLHARLLDMFIMDLDRHEDQWRWGTTEKQKGKTYFPIPRDRDQAFFINTGIFPSMARKPWIAPMLQGFREHAININTFNFGARNLDRSLLNALTEEDWKKHANQLVGQMTDETIEKAIHLQPKEIYGYSGDKIIATLKARRNYMTEEAIQYYKFLAKQVEVAGSDKNELFDVMRNDDGSVVVTIYKMGKAGDMGTKLYERKFLYNETKEVRLYGMGGDDKFVVHGNGSETIKIRIIGGTGNDIFDNNAGNAAAGKTVIYDLKTEQNQFTGSGRYRNKLSDDSAVNKFDRYAYKYDVLAPFLSIAYNPDDGAYLGLSFTHTKHAFRKTPFSVRQRLNLVHSLLTKAFNVKYGLEATDIFGKADLLLGADFKVPAVNYFFGLGNETEYDRSIGKNNVFYRTRFTLGSAGAQVRIKPAPAFTISAGPAYQFFSISKNENEGRFITNTSSNGLDSISLFKNKNYFGPLVDINVDTRDNKILPARGVNWQTRLIYYGGLNSFSKSFTQVNTDLSFYTAFSGKGTVVLALRFGGGANFGGYEFFQAQYLSTTENLRGFRKYRFGGDKMAYNNTELRIRLANFSTSLFPGSFGILMFNDIGRVWLKDETSEKWHDGYGGGIWLSPLRRLVITGSLTNSDEGSQVLVSFGFQF